MTAIQSSTRFAPLSTHSVTIPGHLSVKPTKENLLTAFHQFGYDGEQFFGTAFIQGKRLQFTTAMPISTMLTVSKIDRAKAGSGVTEVMLRANRPRIAGHAKALREYFKDTACAGEKFILPAFAFNFGDESTTDENAPEAILYIYANPDDTSTNGWPALFQLPRAIKLDTTDGGHRGGEMTAIIEDTGSSFTTEQERENLRRNACDVKIIFEPKRVDAHQDFADCAKAKPITGSLIATFDVRDFRNQRAVKLVEDVPFLQHYVDATAANVNLSSGSIKIWSMSAVRSFISHLQGQGRYPSNQSLTAEQVAAELATKMAGAEEFFMAVIKYLAPLQALEIARLEAEARKNVTPTSPPIHTETAKTFRNIGGGDIMFRGVGMSLFARAFEHAKTTGMSYDEVARRLSLVDWHLLDCERSALPNPETDEGRQRFAQEVNAHLNPIWASMIIVGESRYKIVASNEEVNQAWSRILAKHFDGATQALPQASQPQVSVTVNVAA
jgi:DNA-sulfur modification-associated